MKHHPTEVEARSPLLLQRGALISSASRGLTLALTLSAVASLAGCSGGALGPMDGDPAAGTGGKTNVGGDGDGTGGFLSGDGDGDGSGGTTTKPPPGEVPGGVHLKGAPAYHAVVRLTHAQWSNSITDIFGVDTTDALSSLHPDPPNGTFSNNELSLYVTGELWNDYQRVAEEIAEEVATTPMLNGRFGGLTNRGAFIDNVARRAFRRSLTPTEKSAYEGIWDEGAMLYSSGDATENGARVFLEAILQSPHFIYRLEVADKGARLSGVQIATKLSLLLNDSLPSDDLLNAAEEGEFDTDAGVLAAAEELLDSESAKEALNRFHVELYGMDRYKNIDKSSTLFPRYNTNMNQALLDADLMFFGDIYESDGGLRDVLTSPETYVNAQIAPFYGLTATGTNLTKVTLGPERPGYLTRVGFLALNSTLVDPDPIHRGVDVNRRILCAELEPPSGTIPPLPETQPGQTNRERVTAHTGSGGCAKCHLKVINPPGFAFENFDAMGQVRTMDNGNPIDTADEYEFNDGIKAFADAPELIQLVAEHPQAHPCYSANLTEFVLARDVAGTEEELVTAMQEVSLDSDASLKELVLMAIRNPLFSTTPGGTL